MGGITPEVYRNDLLRAVIYPESDDTTSLDEGVDEVYDRVEYCYNRLGEQTQVKDQNATVHDYVFDGLGRLTQDKVTAYDGDLIDDAVLRIDRAYEVRGMIEKISSYNTTTPSTPPSAGQVVNEVFRQYNDWGLLAKEYQAHGGEVDADHNGTPDAGVPCVEYHYADADHGLRLDWVRYPNERKVHYTYGTENGDNDALNRLEAIKDDDGYGYPDATLASYEYLGLGTIVIEDYESIDVKLDLWGGTSGEYQGFDQFGRVVDQKWTNDAGTTVIDEYKYGYDRAGNRAWKENVVAHDLETPVNLDELYAYDDVYRLIGTQRGRLTSTNPPTITTSSYQNWTLDGLGNFAVFNDDGTIQDRTVNAANQIQDISDSAGTVTPEYDAAGNMIVAPKTGDEDVPIHYVYDAWNRQVGVYADEDGELGALIAEYKYDGQNRRVEKTATADAPGGARQVEYYFNQNWQLLEERKFDSESAPVESHVYVWSQRYIDAPILRDTYDSV